MRKKITKEIVCLIDKIFSHLNNADQNIPHLYSNSNNEDTNNHSQVILGSSRSKFLIWN